MVAEAGDADGVKGLGIRKGNSSAFYELRVFISPLLKGFK